MFSCIGTDWNRLDSKKRQTWLEFTLCAVCFAVGVWYLSVTLCASLSGDDLVNNPSGYYYITHTPFLQALQDSWQRLADAFTLKNSRFFPLTFPPEWIKKWVLKDVATYRLYIIGYTYLDTALLGWLTAKVLRSRQVGMAVFCVMPLMIGIWAEPGGNAMYSYNGLVQTTLLPALLAGGCVLRWHDTHRVRWAILGALLFFWSCGTYELGFVLIIPLAILAILYTDKIKSAVRLVLPLLAGEFAALSMNVLSRLANSTQGVYDGVRFSLDPARILLAWVRQMSAGFALNPMFFAKARFGTVGVKDIVLSLAIALITVYFLWKPVQALTYRALCGLFAMGASLLIFPAALLSLSEKYQEEGWVNWQQGYLPETLEALGTCIIFAALLFIALRWLRDRKVRQNFLRGAAVVLVVLLTVSGVYQRSAARDRYQQGGDEYNLLCDSLEAGLVNDVPQNAPIICDFIVWDGSRNSQSILLTRYAGKQMDAWHRNEWLTAQNKSDDQAYACGQYVNYGGYGVMWAGTIQDEENYLLENVKIYVDGNTTPDTAVLKYYKQEQNGAQTICAVPLAVLPQSGRTAQNGYFVYLNESNVAAPKIMIWDS